MNTLDAIYARRSIRAFNGQDLSEEELAVILKAAYASPHRTGQIRHAEHDGYSQSGCD